MPPALLAACVACQICPILDISACQASATLVSRSKGALTGSRLAGAFIERDLVDELVLYQAPKIMGDGGKGLALMPTIESLTSANTMSPVGAASGKAFKHAMSELVVACMRGQRFRLTLTTL